MFATLLSAIAVGISLVSLLHKQTVVIQVNEYKPVNPSLPPLPVDSRAVEVPHVN